MRDLSEQMVRSKWRMRSVRKGIYKAAKIVRDLPHHWPIVFCWIIFVGFIGFVGTCLSLYIWYYGIPGIRWIVSTDTFRVADRTTWHGVGLGWTPFAVSGSIIVVYLTAVGICWLNGDKHPFGLWGMDENGRYLKKRREMKKRGELNPWEN